VSEGGGDRFANKTKASATTQAPSQIRTHTPVAFLRPFVSHYWRFCLSDWRAFVCVGALYASRPRQADGLGGDGGGGGLFERRALTSTSLAATVRHSWKKAKEKDRHQEGDKWAETCCP